MSRGFGRLSRAVFCLVVLVPTFAHADVVTSWNAAALNAIRENRTPPPIASRALAILHASIYDAINGIVRSHEPYFMTERGPANASTEAAASAAAFVVLASLFPESAQAFEALHEATVRRVRSEPHRVRGVAWGESVARQLLAWRASDNFDAIVQPPYGTGPGAWQPTPPGFAPYALPQWGFVTPFAMPANAHFRPAGPPPVDSGAYAADYNEVKALGAAVGSSRTPEQDVIALFWADGAGTETPPGHWNSIARSIAHTARNTLEENARLFALLNVAMADAAICSWDAKYTYNFWRPVTAIRSGDLDGNPATAGDPEWSSFIATPPFPDYVSGHSTFSAAASVVLALFYGTDRIPFSTASDFLPGVTRHFERLSAAASEAAVSRLYGGIHYRSANEDGLAAGREIGAWTVRTIMRPIRGPRHDRDAGPDR